MFQGIFKSAINDANKNYIFGTGSIPINIKTAQLATFADGTTKQQGYQVAEVNKLISTMLTGWDANGNKPKSMSDNYLELILSCDNGFVVKKRLQFPHIIAWQDDSTPYNIADVYKEFSIDNWLKADDFENPDITLVVEPTDEILTTSTATPPEATTEQSGRFYLYYRNLPVGVNRVHIDFHIKTKTEPIDFDLEILDGLLWKDAQTILASNDQAKINVLLGTVKDVYKFTGAEGNFEEITMHEWSALYQSIINLNPNNKFTHDLYFYLYEKSEVIDYDDLVNKPTFKTVNGQSILGSGNIQSAESITNSPDNITIEEVNSVLRLKDFSGSSYKYGFKHIYDDITINGWTDISSWANSIVEIKGTITLTGSTHIHIPDNCILYFNGGSIKSGDFTAKLYPHSAKIIAHPYQIFYGDIKISKAYGNDLFYADTVYGEWFGAKGDGVTPDGWAFAKLTKSVVHCNKIQLLKKTYILERNINIYSCTLSGYGSTLKRYSKFADVLITEPTVVSSSDTHVLTVDTNSDTYSNLEVGMAVFIMNKSTDSRQVVGGRWVISEINGESITIVGNTMDVVYDANTMCLVTGFSLINLHGKNSRIEGVILDGLLNLTSPIYPLDRTPWEVDCTIGGGYNVENASIEDCYIINSLADGIKVRGKNNIFSHNTILHSGANGIHLSGNYIVHIDNNYIFDSNLNPLTLHNEGAITYSNCIFEVTITNNIFDNCLAGIGSIDSADDCKSIIVGNIFRNFRTHGIQGAATSTSYGSITRQFIINNNRFIATQDDAASWETQYLYTPNIPRQEATGYGILLNGYSNALWDSIIINNNNFEDCGVCIKYALSTMFSNNLIRIEHNFTSSTPNDIIQLINSNGAAQNNVVKSNSQSKTNCFKLTNSKVLVSGNAYNLTGCSLSDATYELLKDNTDIS